MDVTVSGPVAADTGFEGGRERLAAGDHRPRRDAVFGHAFQIKGLVVAVDFVVVLVDRVDADRMRTNFVERRAAFDWRECLRHPET
jgi:hypothetical protein